MVHIGIITMFTLMIILTEVEIRETGIPIKLLNPISGKFKGRNFVHPYLFGDVTTAMITCVC